jgi:hypothetical protein
MRNQQPRISRYQQPKRRPNLPQHKVLRRQNRLKGLSRRRPPLPLKPNLLP